MNLRLTFTGTGKFVSKALIHTFCHQILPHDAVYAAYCRRSTDDFVIAAFKAEYHTHDFTIPAAYFEATGAPARIRLE